MQPLREEAAATDGGSSSLMVSAIAADTAARLLAARFAMSAACGAVVVAREVADAGTDGIASVHVMIETGLPSMLSPEDPSTALRVKKAILARGCQQPSLALTVVLVLARSLKYQALPIYAESIVALPALGAAQAPQVAC